MAGIISAVEPGSIAAEKLFLAPGDVLLAINGREITDMIDYNFAACEEELTLTVQKPGGDVLQVEFEHDGWEDIGLVFESEVFDGIRPCRNHCLFCFIDQLQPAPRASLLIKDDDYRMSFLEGNYITGTNLREEDFARIAAMRLSPLYISVQATEPQLRGYLLGLPKPAPVLPLLKRLIDCGVAVHTQIVLCPGINDGAALAQTISDLAALAPGVASIAVVPVGLTRFQRNQELRQFTAEEAAQLLDWLAPLQKSFLKQYGTRLVFAADELYLRANRAFPSAAHYEEFGQLENGIGMAALFAKEWRRYGRRLTKHGLPDLAKGGNTALVTGASGAAALAPAMPDIKAASGGMVELIPVENDFYGPSVTVTGLLTGSCLINALPRGIFDRYIIPDVMLKHGSEIFLDDMTVEQVAETLQTPVTVATSNAEGLYKALIGEL